MRTRLLAAIALLLLALLAVATWRAARVAPIAVPQVAVPAVAIDPAASAARLAAALAFATVADDDRAMVDPAVLRALFLHLEQAFPRVVAALESSHPGGNGWLLRWRGRDAAARPLLLAAHLDVVPAAAEGWTHPPFAGEVADGFVWGRGALDDKSSALAILEAVDALLATGFVPETDVYLAFGGDEETGGASGAARIAEALRARGVRIGCVLDEGSFVLEGVLPIARRPVALIGIGERGDLTVELSAHGRGGHAAVPAPDNPVSAVARAIARIDAAPAPPRATRSLRAMLDALAPEAAPAQRLLLANRWLTEPLLVRWLARGGVTSAMVATTSAPTLFDAGTKDNVVPRVANARVNLRLLEGDDSAAAMARLRATIDDPAVTVRALPPVHEPSPVSPAAGSGWDAIAGAVAAVFPDVAIVPGPVIATTDSRHYVAIADDVFRFLPVRLAAADVARVHGSDERIGVQAHADAIRFYATVIAAWRAPAR